MKKIIIPAAVLLALGITGSASAHTPTVNPSCSGLAVKLVDYEAGNGANNRVTISIDGQATKVDYGGSYTHAFPWSPNGHSWSVVVDANRQSGNPTQYDRQFSGSVESCQPTSSLPAPSTSTTTTTRPLVTTTTSVPASSTSAPRETSTSSTPAASTSTPTTNPPPPSSPSTSVPPTTNTAPTSTAGTTNSSTPAASRIPSTSVGSTSSTSGSGAATTGKALPMTCLRAESCGEESSGVGVPAPLYGLVVGVLLVGVPWFCISRRKRLSVKS